MSNFCLGFVAHSPKSMGRCFTKPVTGLRRVRAAGHPVPVCGDEPFSVGAEGGLWGPGAAQVSSLLEKEGAKQIPVLSQGITLNLLTRSCRKNADCRAALNLRARSCFSVCTFWSRNTSSQSCISYFVGPSTCTAERIPIPLKSMGVLLLKRIKPGTWPAFGNWNVVVTRSLCGHYGFHRLQRQWFECSCYQPYRKIRSCRMHSWVWLAAGML